MRICTFLYSSIVAVIVASVFVSSVFVTVAQADELNFSDLFVKPNTDNNWSQNWVTQVKPTKKQTLRELKASLDDSDIIAALKALDIALNEVGDGATFIWRKKNNNLKGAIKPTAVYRSPNGRICRQLVFALSLGEYVKTIHSTACRADNGSWVLKG